MRQTLARGSRGWRPGRLLFLATAVAVALLLGQAAPALAGTGLKKIHDPRKVTYSRHIHSCHFRDDRKLPSRRCTPGSVDPAVAQRDIGRTICKRGWTATVRPPESQTEHAKYHVAYPAYHVKRSTRSELDHLVPLELGGSNDITNLWPEIGKVPNPKDKVENALHRAVCAGKVRLAAAQRAIAANWTTAIARLHLTAWCTAKAAYNAKYRDYDVYVHSNQPRKTATARSSTDTRHRKTNDSGYADIYLYAHAGDRIMVTVGAASCSTRAR